MGRVKTIALSCAVQKTALAAACVVGRGLGGNWPPVSEATKQLQRAFDLCPDIAPSA